MSKLRKIGVKLLSCLVLLMVCTLSVQADQVPADFESDKELGAPLRNRWGYTEYNDISDISLLARGIWVEAEDEPYAAKKGIFLVLKNRKAFTEINPTVGKRDFGKANIRSLILHDHGLNMKSSRARRPDYEGGGTREWMDCANIARIAIEDASNIENTVKDSLFFMTQEQFKNSSEPRADGTYIKLPNTKEFKKVITEVRFLYSEHVFFNIEGYEF